MGEVLAQLSRALQIVDAKQRVVVSQVSDAGLVQPAGQPLASVDVNLAVIRDPALDSDVHEPELRVDQIHVVVQALTLSAIHLDGLGLEALAHLEAHA